jgi:sporulation protein YlmC with PRC-barrel domain
MDLVRDMLDKQVVDRNGQELGRVDSIIFEVDARGAATVSAIEVGLIAFGERLHPFFGRCARAIELLLGIEADRPVRIPVAKIIDVGKDIKVDLASTDTPVLALEQKARRVVSSIPGA